MRASRLLSILMLLQTRGRMSASVLAAEMGVSSRTILRDLDQLSLAGVPVWSDRGRDGGFQLREGWRTHLTGLTEIEAQALLLAGLPGAAMELGLGTASASAQLKMLAALPTAQRDQALKVSSRLHLDPIDWFRVAVPVAYLQLVADAVWHQRIIDMRYQSWKGVSDRTVKPLGLVLKAGVWYLSAQADESKEIRIYRLDKIQKLEVQKNYFRRPKKFNLAHFWKTSIQRFENGIYQGRATLRVSERGMKRLRQFNANIREAVANSATPDPVHADLIRVVIPVESVEYSAAQLLGLGAEIEVLEPAELRTKMQCIVKQLSTLYFELKEKKQKH